MDELHPNFDAVRISRDTKTVFVPTEDAQMEPSYENKCCFHLCKIASETLVLVKEAHKDNTQDQGTRFSGGSVSSKME